MARPPGPHPDEQARMNILLGLNVLDTTPEEHFDGLVNLGKCASVIRILTEPEHPLLGHLSVSPRATSAPDCRHMFNVPICLVTLVDVERQWFKACVGLDVSQTGRQE